MLVSIGVFAARAMWQATTKIPIVRARSPIQWRAGLWPAWCAPVDGFTNFDAEIDGKRLKLLKETLPGLSRVAVLANPRNESAPIAIDRLRPAAAQRCLRWISSSCANRTSSTKQLGELVAREPQAAMILSDLFMLSQTANIASS